MTSRTTLLISDNVGQNMGALLRQKHHSESRSKNDQGQNPGKSEVDANANKHDTDGAQNGGGIHRRLAFAGLCADFTWAFSSGFFGSGSNCVSSFGACDGIFSGGVAFAPFVCSSRRAASPLW